MIISNLRKNILIFRCVNYDYRFLLGTLQLQTHPTVSSSMYGISMEYYQRGILLFKKLFFIYLLVLHAVVTDDFFLSFDGLFLFLQYFFKLFNMNYMII